MSFMRGPGPQEPCPKCGTRNGVIGWVNAPEGQPEAHGYLKECDSAFHDKDRDPFRYGFPGEDAK